MKICRRRTATGNTFLQICPSARFPPADSLGRSPDCFPGGIPEARLVVPPPRSLLHGHGILAEILPMLMSTWKVIIYLWETGGLAKLSRSCIPTLK